MLKFAAIASLIVAAGLALLARDLHLWVRWLVYASAGSLVLALIAGGALSGGEHARANYRSATAADRTTHLKLLGGALTFSVITGALAGLAWYFGGR